jgi:hypothetical protein
MEGRQQGGGSRELGLRLDLGSDLELGFRLGLGLGFRLGLPLDIGEWQVSRGSKHTRRG